MNVLTRQAQNKILQEAEAHDESKIKDNDKNISSKSETKKNKNLVKGFVKNSKLKKQKTKPVNRRARKPKKTRAQWEFEILLEAIETVRKGGTRPDCKSFSKFTSLSESAPNFNFIHTPPTCLEEAIFHMEELEDIYDPIELEDNIPEPVGKDKVEHYRQILIQYHSAINGGKCPFSAASEKNKHEEQKTADNNNNNNKKNENENETINKVYQGSVPKWAELVAGEKLFSSEDEEDAPENETRAKKPENYRFAYKSVPFPSIQKTLKKYVSL